MRSGGLYHSVHFLFAVGLLLSLLAMGSLFLTSCAKDNEADQGAECASCDQDHDCNGGLHCQRFCPEGCNPFGCNIPAGCDFVKRCATPETRRCNL